MHMLSPTSAYRNSALVLLLVVLRMQYCLASDQFTKIEVTETDDQPRDTESASDNRIDLCRTTSCNSKVDHAYEHRYVQHTPQSRSKDCAIEAPSLDTRKSDNTDEAGHTVEQESTDVGHQGHLRQIIDIQHAIGTH